jgi:uncharacterized protein YaeQ
LAARRASRRFRHRSRSNSKRKPRKVFLALKSTIFKVELQIADLDRNYYQNHALTVARHPSETDERMMVRVLAFAMYADEALSFGKGLSSEDEPDLWRKDLTGAIELWIEVGLPDEKRIRRACGRARQVVVLTYGGRVADMWWQQNGSALQRNDNLTVINLPAEDSRALATLAERGMALQITLQDGELWLIVDGENIRIVPEIRLAPRQR